MKPFLAAEGVLFKWDPSLVSTFKIDRKTRANERSN
jgi:hypothetical protein